ncbi:hypothetical protein [Sulfurimonas sp. HSL3-7]|uniref:hypothetical protein n=1 Tax=Sulfonitrofixus jiaomeiensis TaxID=3131938 RepID=UPI0031F8F458
MKRIFLVSLLLLTLFTVGLHADAILNINQPVRTLKVNSEQMKSAIINAARELQWQVTPEGEGRLTARYEKSDYMAKITINYAPTFYTINYADSKRMRYDGKTIHPTYNRLIKALQTNIVRNLKSGNFATQTHPAAEQKAESKPAGEEEELRTKLLKIKRLHEEGLITTEEYDAKRKSLIMSY